MIKDDANFKSDVQSANHILHKVTPYEVWPIATRQTMAGRVDEPIQRTMKSMNDLVLMFTPTEATGGQEYWLYR